MKLRTYKWSLLLVAVILCLNMPVFSAEGHLPLVKNAKISGLDKVGSTVKVSYELSDPNRLEVQAVIQWQYSDNNTVFFAIPEANASTFVLNEIYTNKYVRAAITPINSANFTGDTLYTRSWLVIPKSLPDGFQSGTNKNTSRFLDAVTDLQGLEIIDGKGQEDLMLDKTATRAEFAKIVAKVCGWDKLNVSYGRFFRDVPDDHWGASYINFIAANGIFEGTGQGLFEPEAHIIQQDVLKVMVSVLGYRMVADELGYPAGYINQASRLGLLKGVESDFTAAITRSNLFQIIQNALDVDRMVQDYVGGDSNSYSVSRGDTLRNALLDGKDFYEGTGVVTATYEAFILEANRFIAEGEVEIEGIRYKIGNTSAAAYLGKKINYTVYEDEKTGVRTLKSAALHKDVEVLEIKSDDFQSFENYEILYTSDNLSITQKVQIARNAGVVYNNRPITDLEQFNIKNGSIELIDNNNDGVYDIALISDYVSMPVESVNVNGHLIRIKDGFSYNGLRSIAFDVSDNTVQNVACDADGNAMGLEDIESDGLISIFESGCGTFLKLIYSDIKDTGIIYEFYDDYYTIGDKTYSAEKKDVISKNSIRPGNEVVFYLNFAGKIAYIEASKSLNEQYGYIIGVEQKGLSGIKLHMVTAGKVEQREESLDNDPDSDATISVLMAYNDSLNVFEMAAKHFVENSLGAMISNPDVSAIPIKKVIKYKTNTNGEITEIRLPIKVDDDYYNLESDLSFPRQYNAKDNVFAGSSAGAGFGIDEDTVVLCFPAPDPITGISVTSNEDYLAEVKMIDKRSYDIFGYDFEESSSNVKVFAIKEPMLYESHDGVGATTKIAMVQSISQVLNEEGEVVTKLTLLTEGLAKQMIAASYANHAKINTLKVGDVIYYSQNPRREMVDINVIESISKLSNYYNRYPNTDNERIYGKVADIEFSKVSETLIRRTDVFWVQKSASASDVLPYEFQITNSPPIFIYDGKGRENSVSYGTVDDFRTYKNFGNGCDEAFMYVKNKVVQGIVLIRK